MKIFVVDDSMFMRELLSGVLKDAGFSDVQQYKDGVDCINALNTTKPDLILLDIIMPEMNGIDVLKKIGNNMKVLVISAVGQEDFIQEAMHLGALGYIVKPFEKADVIARVQKALGITA